MKTIPIATSFKISEDGKVFGPNGEQNYYRNGDGYVTVAILTNEGIWVTFGVHRLLCITYKPIDDYTVMTSNHIDGDKENNTVGNVEWLTAGMNNIHGTLLNRFTKRPLIKAKSIDHTLILNDIADAENYFGVDLDTVWNAIKNKTKLNEFEVTFIKSNDPEVLKKLNDEIGTVDGYFRSVKMLDLLTDEVKVYSSMHQAAREHGVIVTYIRNRISVQDRPKVFNKRYVIIDVTKDFNFLTDEVRNDLLSRGSKAVIAYSLKDKKFKEYDSAYSFIKENGISKKSVTVRLKKRQIKETTGWLYSYIYKDPKEIKRDILLKASSLDVE